MMGLAVLAVGVIALRYPTTNTGDIMIGLGVLGLKG
jgi:hypothetical protein